MKVQIAEGQVDKYLYEETDDGATVYVWIPGVWPRWKACFDGPPGWVKKCARLDNHGELTWRDPKEGETDHEHV